MVWNKDKNRLTSPSSPSLPSLLVLAAELKAEPVSQLTEALDGEAQCLPVQHHSLHVGHHPLAMHPPLPQSLRHLHTHTHRERERERENVSTATTCHAPHLGLDGAESEGSVDLVQLSPCLSQVEDGRGPGEVSAVSRQQEPLCRELGRLREHPLCPWGITSSLRNTDHVKNVRVPE